MGIVGFWLRWGSWSKYASVPRAVISVGLRARVTVVGETGMAGVRAEIGDLVGLEEGKDVFVSIPLNLPGHPNPSRGSVLGRGLEFGCARLGT